MHSRRARPTLRVMVEDLADGWSSPHPRRNLAEGDYHLLHPLSELPHPLIAKAAETFGDDAAEDNPVGPILCSTRLHLMEIKHSQWRGGVWVDSETGVHWLIVAGLAKGDHADHDDFYIRVEQDEGGLAGQRWLPTEDDYRLLKRETAARLKTDWELEIQRRVLKALRMVHTGGTVRFTVEHPVANQGVISVVILTVEPHRQPDYEYDDIVVEFEPTPKFAGQELLWTLMTRVVATLYPPQQAWDFTPNTFSNIAETGTWTTRIAVIEGHVERGEVIALEPDSHSHYSHIKHIAKSSVDGTSVRSLCGTYFVVCRDHESMPVCPECQRKFDQLPQ